jgi:hypothetical protein
MITEESPITNQIQNVFALFREILPKKIKGATVQRLEHEMSTYPIIVTGQFSLVYNMEDGMFDMLVRVDAEKRELAIAMLVMTYIASKQKAKYRVVEPYSFKDLDNTLFFGKDAESVFAEKLMEKFQEQQKQAFTFIDVNNMAQA